MRNSSYPPKQPGCCVQEKPGASFAKTAGPKSPAKVAPDPEGKREDSGVIQCILGGEILVAEIMGDCLVIDMPCVYVETVGEMCVTP